MAEEIFYIKSDDAFEIPNTTVKIEIKHSLNPNYIIPNADDKLKLVWEYPVDVTKWNYLSVQDNTKKFTTNGTILFEVPKDMVKIELNGEEGYFIRCRIANGDYGKEEKSEYIKELGEVRTTPSTLEPPILSEVVIYYEREREDINSAVIFNNFKYKNIEFIKNIPTPLFEYDDEKEEAIFLSFDSFLSEDYLSIYFEIDNQMSGNRNNFAKQRVLEWKLLQNGEWITLENVEDNSDGLTKSGDIIIKMPKIEKLEKYTIYIEERRAMWIKAQVKFNSLKDSPKIENVLLNSVDVIQQQTFYNELIGKSDGLPNLQYRFTYKNLSKNPIIFVGDEEFKAVDRFIDYQKEDRVFRFNGVTGIIEFGDGEYGAIPKLGENIYIKEYSVTEGKKGNIKSGELKVLREPINYIDSITNYKSATNGEDGDTLEDLKKYAPSILKTMNRAISIEDYELLTQNFSSIIKKAKCVAKEGDIIITILTEDIIEKSGFINHQFIEELKEYLSKRTLLTVQPIIMPPTIISLTVYLKLLYTIKDYNISKIDLEEKLKINAKEYFDPFNGYDGKGFPLGKLINKSDFYTIIHKTDKSIFIDDINFSISNSKNLLQKVNLNYNQLVKIEDIIIEDLSYDV